MDDRPLFTISHVDFAYGAQQAVSDFSLELFPGRFYGIVGPNGCGKTTLLDLMIGAKTPDSGDLLFKDRPLSVHPRMELAKQLALVPQDFGINFPFTVFETALMGRHPHIPRFCSPQEKDIRAVETCLRLVEALHLRNKYVTELSGGEKQRVVLARALAQDTAALLLDEPTSNLDVNHSLAVLRVAEGLVREEHKTVIAVMHDLNLAAAFCDHLVFMKNGRLHKAGPAESTLTSQTLKELFGVDAQIAWSEYAGCATVFFKKDGV